MLIRNVINICLKEAKRLALHETSSTNTMTEANEKAKGEAHSYPEGGTRAWFVVLGCFCVMFYTFGYLNAFGYVRSTVHLPFIMSPAKEEKANSEPV